MSPHQYRIINRTLTIIVVCLGLYLALAPLLPEFGFRFERSKVGQWVSEHVLWWRQEPPAIAVTPRVSMAAGEVSLSLEAEVTENTLLIPTIDVRTPILEGQTSKVLEQGIWHRPKTSTPDAGGNTVLVGHRFLYTSGPHTFYHLDKLKAGDEIMVFWQKKRYTYIVDSVVVTTPTATEIEQPTSQPTLTLYTCTPLFSVDKRLVVRALLKN